MMLPNKTEYNEAGNRITNAIIFLFALLGVLLSVKTNSKLWVLPCAFAGMYLVFFGLPGIMQNWCSGIIIGISFIRYSILPVMYNSNLGSSYVSYLRYSFNNINTTIIVMLFEMIGIFAGILFGEKVARKKYQNYETTYSSENKYYIENTSDTGVASFFIVLLGLGLYITHPALIRGVNQEVVSTDVVSGSVEAVFQVAIIVLALYLLSKIKNSNTTEHLRIIGTLIVFAALIYLASFMATSSSRNCMIINSIILIIYLGKNYHASSQKIVPFIIMAVVFLFSVSTYNRFDSYRVSDNVVASVFQSMFGYQVLNAYFAGPTNIDVGISMINAHGGWYGLGQFFTDFFANVPIVNKLFSGENTVTLYNQAMSHGIANDQIVPITIQSIAYGTYLMTPLLVFISSYYAMRFFYKAKTAHNDLLLYSYSYIAIVFSMSTMLCVNSMSMLIMMRVVPTLIIGRLNYKLVLGRFGGGG